MKCICKSCEELTRLAGELAEKDLGAYKMVLILCHWYGTDEGFRKIMSAAGFNPGKLWWEAINDKGQELGLVRIPDYDNKA